MGLFAKVGSVGGDVVDAGSLKLVEDLTIGPPNYQL